MLLKGHSVRIRTEKSPVDHAKWRWWFTLARTVSKFFYPQQFLWKCRLDHIRLFKTHQGSRSLTLQTTVLDKGWSLHFQPVFSWASSPSTFSTLSDLPPCSFLINPGIVAVQIGVCISCFLLFQEWCSQTSSKLTPLLPQVCSNFAFFEALLNTLFKLHLFPLKHYPSSQLCFSS